MTAAVVALVCGTAAPAAAAEPNPITIENARAGDTGWSGDGGGDIQVYASQTSVEPGEPIDVHVSTANAYRVEVYRLGWYGGAGGRLVVQTPSKQGAVRAVPPQPALTGPPLRAAWPTMDIVSTDSSWVSGYYEIRAVVTSGRDAGAAGTTFVIVRESVHSPASQILVQVPVNTWQAYNQWGGKSLYPFDGPQAYRVSFDRPFGKYTQSPFFAEIQLVRFLEREGYDVSYQADVDTDTRPDSLLAHRLVMTAGHDEYWSRAMRDGFDAALAAGTNLAFMGSNTGYWQIRYEDDHRTIVEYRDPALDPEADPLAKTVLFRDLGRPECMLEGVEHRWLPAHQEGEHDFTVAAPETDPWLTGTGLHPGDQIGGVVGDEWDGLNPVSGLCVHPGLTVLFQHAENSPLGDAQAVRFTAPSGARVFASGAQRFTWGLDTWGARYWGHAGGPNPGLQQFTRNMLDDLTRPAPPAIVRVSRWRESVRVRVGRPIDPRVVDRLVFRQHDGDAPVLVCSGLHRCLVPRATEPGVYRFAAEYVDVWGRTSAPAYGRPWSAAHR